jgi:hypothetical protein
MANRALWGDNFQKNGVLVDSKSSFQKSIAKQNKLIITGEVLIGNPSVSRKERG